MRFSIPFYREFDHPLIFLVSVSIFGVRIFIEVFSEFFYRHTRDLSKTRDLPQKTRDLPETTRDLPEFATTDFRASHELFRASHESCGASHELHVRSEFYRVLCHGENILVAVAMSHKSTLCPIAPCLSLSLPLKAHATTSTSVVLRFHAVLKLLRRKPIISATCASVSSRIVTTRRRLPAFSPKLTMNVPKTWTIWDRF